MFKKYTAYYKLTDKSHLWLKFSYNLLFIQILLHDENLHFSVDYKRERIR